MRRTLTAFFDDYDEAAATVRRLQDCGISYRDISLLANAAGYDGARHHIVPQGSTDDGSAGAASGAAAGGAIGSGLGLLAGLGLITVPGLGPVVAAGWLVAALTGAAAGAATGGLVGILVGEGLGDEEADIYAAGLKRGGSLVVARVDVADYDKARAVLEASPGQDLAARTSAPHGTGWHDAAAPSGAPPAETSPHPLIRSDRVEGTSVYDRDGTHIGKVARLVIDKPRGQVTHVVLSSGALFGAGGDARTLPWDTLTYDTHLQGYRAGLAEDQVRRPPA